ncbi:MAG: drug/metabolite transporter (DMT)-like permease [Gammaproteobacteria bacterium]|jgi:drug/metabolite transporter (DMT)-like permease
MRRLKAPTVVALPPNRFINEFNIGVYLSLVAMLCAVGNGVLTRKLSSSAPRLIMWQIPVLIGALVLLGFMPFVWV